MMKIRKMETEKGFVIDCIQHNAELECSCDELRLVTKRTFEYACPICGMKHLVPAHRVHEYTVFDHDVRLDDKSLPINMVKKAMKAEKATKKAIKRTMKTVKKLLKEIENESSTEDGEQTPEADMTDSMSEPVTRECTPEEAKNLDKEVEEILGKTKVEGDCELY